MNSTSEETIERKIIRNKQRADRVIAFIEKLPIVDGPAVGKNFVVDPFHEDFLRAIYEKEYENGNRVVRRAGLSAARKTAKSYMVAGLLLANLIGPESIPNGQVYSCAVDREQASVIFHMCRKMIEMRPALQKYLKVVPSTKTIYVIRSDVRGRGSVYRALSAESSTKHGLGPSFFVYDELGEARDDILLTTMLDGQQAVASPLAVAISTQNPDPNSAFSLWMDYGLSGQDPSAIAHLHAADPDCDLMDREQWIKANPCLLTWKSFEPIETAAREAVALPSKEQNFRRRYLNQRVSMHSSLIASVDWKVCGPAVVDPNRWTEAETWHFEPGEPLYLGLDMSVTTDLTALVAVSADGEKSRVKADIWKPEGNVAEHAKRDRFPYDVFHKQGWLKTTPGRDIDPAFIAHRIVEIANDHPILGLAFDRYKTKELLRCLDELGFEAQEGEGPGLRLVPWGQGFASMGVAVSAFERAVLNEQLLHDGNPILTNNVMNAQVISDPAGNRKLDKAAARFRIDGAVALSMALGLKAQDRVSAVPHNPYDDPDFGFKPTVTKEFLPAS